MGGVLFDLAAQIADMVAHERRIADGRTPPKRFEQTVRAVELAGMPAKIAEQRKFCGGQAHGTLLHAHAVIGGVQMKRDRSGGVLRARAARQGTHAGLQFTHLERTPQIVITPAIQRAGYRVCIRALPQKEHGRTFHKGQRA